MYWPWLVQKSSVKAIVDLPFDNYYGILEFNVMFISPSMPFNLRQMPIGMETHHFQPNPVVHGPNPYLTRYLPYTLSQSLETYSNR